MSAGNPTERPEERDSLAKIEQRLAFERLNRLERIAALEAEVGELREENARLNGVVDGIAVNIDRIKQLEEALREVVRTRCVADEEWTCEPRKVARAALRPIGYRGGAVTLSPDDLAAMGERHVEKVYLYGSGAPFCGFCQGTWPCHSRRLLDEVETLRGVLEPFYWFFRMVENGGPDGSDVDTAVWEDARAVAASQTTLLIVYPPKREEVKQQTATESST